MRPKSIMLLVLALGCGLVAALGINQVLANRGSGDSASTLETVPVFVAMSDINVGDPLTLQLVKLEPWPKDRVPPGAITKVEDVENRRAKSKLFLGEPILEAKLLAKGEWAAPTDHIPKGWRVVPVKIDMVSNADLILPGDRVDLMVFLEGGGRNGVLKTTTITFLKNIKVFAVDNIYRPEDKQDNAASGKTVMLLVKPDQAEIVNLANEMGKIRLTLRSPNDETDDSTPGADLAALLSPGTMLDGSKATPAAGLLDFLKQQPEPPADEPADEPSDEWTMLIWDGDKSREVSLRDDGRPVWTNANAGGNGFTSDGSTGVKPDSARATDEPTGDSDSEPLSEPFGEPDDEPFGEPDAVQEPRDTEE